MAGKRLKHVTDDGGEILRRLSPVIFRFVPADVTEVGSGLPSRQRMAICMSSRAKGA